MNRFLPLLLLLAVLPIRTTLKAQSTYAQVYQLIQTNCSGYGCHDGASNTFNINVSADSFYHEIMNAAVINPVAAGNFNKLVSPGDIQRSFLLRKISNGISDGLALTAQEGNYMPNNHSALANNEIELVRQWIMFGAPETGNVVDTAMINKYYRIGGINDVYSPHLPPAAGTGFQIYFGRLFLNTNTRDTDVFFKIDPHLTQAVESYKVDFMDPASDHHFILSLFQPGGDAYYRWGLRPFSESSMENQQYGIGSGPGYNTFDLPTNTAFYFQQGQMFDLDIHIQNPVPDSIYSCEIYVNVYTEPANTTNHYMKTVAFINQDIAIPEDGQSHSFNITAQDSSRTNNWDLWKLYSHTHRYGTGFNMWLANPDGSKGAQIYDGNYSYEEGFDVGYYRWGPHSTIRTWPNDSLFPINPLSGIIAEATWKNTAGPDTVWWGFSSYDEMEVIFLMYVDGDPIQPTAVNTTVKTNLSTMVFPNPVTNEFVLKYDLDEPGAVQVDLLDLLGNKVTNLLTEQTQATGQYTHGFNASDYKLSAGVYLVSFNIGGKVQTQKLILTE